MRRLIAILFFMAVLTGCDGDRHIDDYVTDSHWRISVYKCGKNSYCSQTNYDFVVLGIQYTCASCGTIRKGDHVDFTYNPTWGVRDFNNHTHHDTDWTPWILGGIICAILGFLAEKKE